MATLPVRDAGLISCCIAALEAYDGDESEGTVIECEHCRRSMKVERGWWWWMPVDTTEARVFRRESRAGLPKRGGRWTTHPPAPGSR